MQKYGESVFDVLYLVTALVLGVWLLVKRKDKAGLWMGIATLTLGFGDAFHLVPRILAYFLSADLTLYLGIGKLVTSITMTVFYVLIYHVFIQAYHFGKDKFVKTYRLPLDGVTMGIYGLAILRIALCAFPQNDWTNGGSVLAWGIGRNVPFLLLGIVIVVLYAVKRKEIKSLRPVWLWITLSFAFYIPVVVGAGAVPVLGMLMLPKTICYVLIVASFVRYTQTVAIEDKPTE